MLCVQFVFLLIVSVLVYGLQILSTYFDLSAKPFDKICPQKFAELDHILVTDKWFDSIRSVRSDRNLALQSHHFAVVVELDIQIPRRRQLPKQPSWNTGALRATDVAKSFSQEFVNHCCAQNGRRLRISMFLIRQSQRIFWQLQNVSFPNLELFARDLGLGMAP